MATFSIKRRKLDFQRGIGKGELVAATAKWFRVSVIWGHFHSRRVAND